MSLLFYQASHEGRIYLLPKLQKRVALRFRVIVSESDTFRKQYLNRLFCMHAVDYLNARSGSRVKSDGSKLESGHPPETFYKLRLLKTLFEQFRYVLKYFSDFHFCCPELVAELGLGLGVYLAKDIGKSHK